MRDPVSVAGNPRDFNTIVMTGLPSKPNGRFLVLRKSASGRKESFERCEPASTHWRNLDPAPTKARSVSFGPAQHTFRRYEPKMTASSSELWLAEAAIATPSGKTVTTKRTFGLARPVRGSGPLVGGCRRRGMYLAYAGRTARQPAGKPDPPAHLLMSGEATGVARRLSSSRKQTRLRVVVGVMSTLSPMLPVILLAVTALALPTAGAAGLLEDLEGPWEGRAVTFKTA